MLRTIPNPNRKNLGFVEATLTAFDFLVHEYGFHVVSAEPTFVRYESGDTFVNVYHGRASYELGAEVGLLVRGSGQFERAFSIGDVLDLLGTREKAGHTCFQASTAGDVMKLVPKLGGLVEEYAVLALKSDPQIFERLSEAQKTASDKLLTEWNLSDVRQEADKAWQQKNYARLAELYESIRAELTPAENKKLEYAKRNLA